MSGGHWNYNQYKLEDYLKEVGLDGEIINRFPKIAQVFTGFGKALGKIMKDLDWDLSGDSSIKNDKEFEFNAIRELGIVLEKKYKIRIYEVDSDEQ